VLPAGVSTCRMDKLVQALGITGPSRSQVSEMAKNIDWQVEGFRSPAVGRRFVHVSGRGRPVDEGS
jgi:transposase-like protein